MAEKPLFMDAERLGDAIRVIIDQIPLGAKIGGRMSDDGTTELVGFDGAPEYPLAGRFRDGRVPMMEGGVLTGSSEVVEE